MGTARPGREIRKEYREIATYQIDRLGWRYDASGKGHPVLYPADRSKRPLAVPTTPTRSPRAIRNFVAEVRRRGGTWPPPERR
jgi:hypothetical protein